MSNIKQFKSELRALLKKHNASISCYVEGDTHGIHNEQIYVEFRDATDYCRITKKAVLVNDWEITDKDI